MPPKKDTAHRPSQANQEFVTTADGRRVRNTAYTGKASAGKRSAPAAPSAAKSATEPATESEKLFDALDNMQHGSIEWDPADLIDSDSVVVSNNGNVVSAPLIRPKIAETSTGIEYRIEAVHVISGKPTQRGLKQHLAETFSKMRNNETDRYSHPVDSEGRFKQLVITDEGEFFVDGKRGVERLRPGIRVRSSSLRIPRTRGGEPCIPLEGREIWRFPRTRGGEPDGAKKFDADLMYSPHTRG